MTERTFAEILPSGKIGNIIVATPEHIATREGEWIETFPSNPARRDGTYNSTLKKFIFPKPHRSWSLDNKGKWQPPTPRPTADTQLHIWDEETKTWKVRSNRRPILEAEDDN